MSDNEDDYLSDKFLLEPASTPSSGPKTYSQRRKDAARVAAIKNAQNRKRSRREMEVESREEGLSKSLFERAQEEEASVGQQNKALAMMMKMGFKPGQALGQTEEDQPLDPVPSSSFTSTNTYTTTTTPRFLAREAENVLEHGTEESTADGLSGNEKPSVSMSKHRIVPLPLNEWAGKKGIGLGKRATSPNTSERLAKMAKMAEEHEHQTYRDRARLEYEERRAESRLTPAQSTCITLDEKAGKEFNVLWLNPHNPATFPEGFIDALEDPLVLNTIRKFRTEDTIEGRLRAKMQADSLRPLNMSLDHQDEPEQEQSKSTLRQTPYSEEDIEEATQFLRLTAKDRLELVLGYLRQKYCYCFWCGTQYTDEEDMGSHCPGPEEDDHD